MDDKLGVATLTNSDEDYIDPQSGYRHEMCDQIKEMFKRGKTVAHFCATHSIGKDTFAKWRKKYKRFEDAYVIAEQYARDYWDGQRDAYMVEDPQSPKMNWNAFNKMYSARFNIPDKRTVKVKGLAKAKDEREMLKCLSQAVHDEELTPDEASKLLGLVDTSLRVKQTNELEDRLKQLEESIK